MRDYKTEKQPDWLNELCRAGSRGDLTGYDTAAINQGGCMSGAFMPAVTYRIAEEIMVSHGDQMLDLIEEGSGLALADLAVGQTSVGGLACLICSLAVELWCGQFDGSWEDDG